MLAYFRYLVSCINGVHLTASISFMQVQSVEATQEVALDKTNLITCPGDMRLVLDLQLTSISHVEGSRLISEKSIVQSK